MIGVEARPAVIIASVPKAGRMSHHRALMDWIASTDRVVFQQ
jgi:hypothetical protein